MSENQEKLNEQLFNVIANDKDSDEVRLKKLKYLVYLGADVNAKLYGKSALSWAIEQNAGVEVQNFLREKGAKEWVISKVEANELGKELLKIVWSGEKEEVLSVIKKGANLETRDGDGSTPLMRASWVGNIEVVKVLLKEGADVKALNNDGVTALMEASDCQYFEVIDELIKYGADLNVIGNNGWTALMKASYCGSVEGVSYLLNKGVDAEIIDNEGRSALELADYKGNEKVVELLKNYKAKNAGGEKDNRDNFENSKIDICFKDTLNSKNMR